MTQKLLSALGRQPIIAAARSRKDAVAAARSRASVVFLLGGGMAAVAEHIALLRSEAADKLLFVHLDLVEGLAKDAKAVHFLAQYARPDGMLTTKHALIRPIQSEGLLAGQRCFMLDSQSYDIAVKSVAANRPDLVELMPGIMPRVIARFCEETRVPVIAGGLIETREDVEQALTAGAVGISSSRTALLE